jgi:hypothetical protein
MAIYLLLALVLSRLIAYMVVNPPTNLLLVFPTWPAFFLAIPAQRGTWQQQASRTSFTVLRFVVALLFSELHPF